MMLYIVYVVLLLRYANTFNFLSQSKLRCMSMARTVKCHICYNHCGRRRKTCVLCSTTRALPGCCPESCWIAPLMMCRPCVQNIFFKHSILPEDIIEEIIGYIYSPAKRIANQRSQKRRRKNNLKKTCWLRTMPSDFLDPVTEFITSNSEKIAHSMEAIQFLQSPL